MNSFEQIINAWPSIGEFANDMGVNVETARGWRKRDSIPAKYWKRLLNKASQRNISISADILVDLAARN